MFEKEITAAVLSPSEQLLGFLNPRQVQIKETNELYKLRNITITHPLFDENTTDLSHYDTLLNPGNKLWRGETADGNPVLYVLLGEKEYDFENKTVTIYGEEAATELSQNQIFRSSAFNWKVNTSFINTYFGGLFQPGTLDGPATATPYNGALTPMAIIRAVEAKTGGEFQFRYVLENGRINRYIDFLDQVGSVHNTPIRLGYNASKITLSVNEADTRIAAAPIGNPTDANSTFHQAIATFTATAIDPNTTIPLYVTKDDDGNAVNGPLVNPPYYKPAGQNYVECDNQGELVASYQRIQKAAAASRGTYPRIHTFETNEENTYNIYWLCVDNLRQHLEPEINIECDVLDIKKLQGLTGEHYNTGDTVYIGLPGRLDTVEARVLKTVKDPRNPAKDSITIGNYQTNFMADFFKGYYKSAGNIIL